MKKSSFLPVILSALCCSLLFTNCKIRMDVSAGVAAYPCRTNWQRQRDSNLIRGQNLTAAKGSAQQFVFPSNVTTAIMNSSAILVYMTNGTPNNATSYGWYAIPGIVPSNGVEHEFYYETSFAGNTAGINIYRKLASTASLSASTRIVIIPANDIRGGRKNE
jgi:hypothetical protein